ncbi:hypothetical protein Psed_6539 [Pseudonocardia dioxanivorans CB1190]|uniref:Lipoprotein n=1 Tax=Pseudonocardia dioxanivorans (strain ATCC 55486 / DSM 44775 / JCM 13855 / CB1190) TaxID=675635 RepID=F4CV82_PSEUX|nr:hypothetical protein [Pseudonocardia dioxanivorans]AEA28628.1 hypothetical protein Psed_6539 [Pseudonocardia dioxanivorans CB1190]
MVVPRLRAAVLGLAAAAALLAACGGPSATYVTNSADKTYLKVPNTWHQIDPAQFTAALGTPPADSSAEGTWIVGYDADSAPELQHMFDPQTEEPLVLVSVDGVPEKSRGQVSLDVIRDFRFPVSASARQDLMLSGSASRLTDFQMIADEVLTPGHGVRGVHSVYVYRLDGGPPQVFDQLGYLNDDASKVYMAIARCSADCFQKRQSEIEGVVNSFTVREDSP